MIIQALWEEKVWEQSEQAKSYRQGCGAGGSPEHILKGGSALLCCCLGDRKQRVGDVSAYIRIAD